MTRYQKPNPKELVIAKGNYKGTTFVTIGIIREIKGHSYLVSTVGPKISWSLVTKWDYLSSVASAYDIWANAEIPDPLGGVSYPRQNRTSAT